MKDYSTMVLNSIESMHGKIHELACISIKRRFYQLLLKGSLIGKKKYPDSICEKCQKIEFNIM